MNYFRLNIFLLIAFLFLFLGVCCASAADLTNSSKIVIDESVAVPGSFDELNSDIQNITSGGHYTVSKDYVFDNTKEKAYRPSIDINVDNVTIDGNMHTITIKNSIKGYGFFNVLGNNVTIKNFKFVNEKPASLKSGISNPDILRIINANMKNLINWVGNNGHLSDCVFEGNSAFNGGVIKWSGSNGIIEYNKFINNFAWGVGGSIYLSNVNTTVRNCYFVNSSSKLGQDEIYLDKNHKNIKIEDCGFVSKGQFHVIDGNITKIDTNKLVNVVFSNMANETVDLVPMVYKSIMLGGVNSLDNNISYYATIHKNEFVLSTSKYLENGITYLKDYHIKNVTNFNDVFTKLINNDYSNCYQFIVNVTVNNTKDYENILNNKSYHFKSAEGILKKDIGALNKIQYTSALNINFLRQMELNYIKPISPNDLGFDLININGHNSTIKGSFNSRSEDHWAKVDQRIFTASNLNIEGFNSAVINNAGNCIFTNVTFKDNKMDYWFQKDWGGAILNTGSVLCNNCSFVGNYAKWWCNIQSGYINN